MRDIMVQEIGDHIKALDAVWEQIKRQTVHLPSTAKARIVFENEAEIVMIMYAVSLAIGLLTDGEPQAITEAMLAAKKYTDTKEAEHEAELRAAQGLPPFVPPGSDTLH